jgi:hypothetical protein
MLSEWRPSGATLLAWAILSIPIVAIGLLVYLGVALHGEFRGSATIYFTDMIAELALVLVLACIHEGVHGIVMMRCGARPEFGVLKIGGILAGFYATAPGHRFGRRQYLIVAFAPLAVLAPLGVLACLLPFGAYLAVPFAIHLAGCIGDMTIAWHVMRQPSGTFCEDLRDGTRFWTDDASTTQAGRQPG